MAVTITGTSVNFPNYTVYDGDVTAIKSLSSPVDGTWCFSTGWNGTAANLPLQASRSVGYITRMRAGYYSNIPSGYTYAWGWGLNYAGANLDAASSYDTISYTNTSLNRSVQVSIRAFTLNPANFMTTPSASTSQTRFFNTSLYAQNSNAGRPTDDGCINYLYRGGSPANSTTHSGGTLLSSQYGSILYFDTIPANTTYTYWHYAGIWGGSGGDHVATSFRVDFEQFV